MVVLFQNLYLIKKIVVNEQSNRKQEIAAFLAWEKEPHIWANAQEGSISWSIRGGVHCSACFWVPKQKPARAEAQIPLASARDSQGSCFWMSTGPLREHLTDCCHTIRAERLQRVLPQIWSSQTASDVTLMCLQSVVNVQKHWNPLL